MSEPLVTRQNDHGVPYLRGTGLRVSAIQAWADAGHTVADIRYQYQRVIGQWPDADIATALTYPRIGQTVYPGAPVKVVVDDDGAIELEGWFRGDDVPVVIAAIQEAADLVADWEQACREWEGPQR